MAVYKRKYDSGTVLWYFKFQPPGAARGSLPIRQFGFSAKREAEDAEAARCVEEQQKYELAKAGSGVAASPPKTLSMLLEEFFRQHVEKKLAPKTTERYHEQAKYLNPDLLAMPRLEITPLHLSHFRRPPLLRPPASGRGLAFAAPGDILLCRRRPRKQSPRAPHPRPCD